MFQIDRKSEGGGQAGAGQELLRPRDERERVARTGLAFALPSTKLPFHLAHLLDDRFAAERIECGAQLFAKSSIVVDRERRAPGRRGRRQAAVAGSAERLLCDVHERPGLLVEPGELLARV
ncbi:MAG: hypothetical protein M1482_15755 [Chloroflexi bacterium]|nr:hypothetical protein [Chloroflexota bacterium]